MIAGSYGNAIFSFVRNCQRIFPKWLYHFTFVSTRVLVASFLPVSNAVRNFILIDGSGLSVLICSALMTWFWASFHMLIAIHLSSLSREVSVKIFCPFLNWFIIFLWLGCKSYIFSIPDSFIRYMICKYFLPFYGLSFHFFDGSICKSWLCVVICFSS